MDKLEERLRDAVVMEHSHAMSERDKLDETTLGTEAAGEITRLNAEVERLQHKQIATDAQSETNRREADDHAEAANRWRNEWGEAQTLIDEMVEGLEEYLFAEEIDDAAVRQSELSVARQKTRALILKARGKDANVG